MAYTLLVYKETPEDDTVRISGVAEHHPNAWRFSAACPDDSTVTGVIRVLEKVAGLDNN